jgi:transposase-like protein
MNADTLPSKRPHTKKRDCPSCHRSFEFWHTSGMSECAPHFYCDRCSSVIWRESDGDAVALLGKKEEAAAAIVATLPPCGCGGRFIATSGPKCPHCGFLFIHQSGVAERLLDPYLILVDGATFYHERRAIQRATDNDGAAPHRV